MEVDEVWSCVMGAVLFVAFELIVSGKENI